MAPGVVLADPEQQIMQPGWSVLIPGDGAPDAPPAPIRSTAVGASVGRRRTGGAWLRAAPATTGQPATGFEGDVDGDGLVSER
ncbi:MAG: hypothetical protein R2705_23145 [Ilumatobacteraceae bacterium]